MSSFVNQVVDHFKSYSVSTIIVKLSGFAITILVCLALFVAPIIGLQSYCFFRATCALFTWLGWFQLFIFVPLWLTSWIKPKVGGLTLLGWSIVCVFGAFMSAFGGWKTLFSTAANLVNLAASIAMVVVEVQEDKKGVDGYERTEYEDDIG